MPKEIQNYITWQTPEFKHYHKNLGWHITFWGIVTLIIGYQIVTKDYFGALSVFLIAGFAAYLLKQRPGIVEVRITDQGMHIDELQIPYKNMRHFWIVDTETHRTLNIETSAYLNRFIILELEDQDPEIIRQILAKSVPEHDSTEPTLVQKLMHRLNL